MNLASPVTHDTATPLVASAKITVIEPDRFRFDQIGDSAGVSIDDQGNVTIDWPADLAVRTARIELTVNPPDSPGPVWQFVGVTVGWGREVGPPWDRGSSLRCSAMLETKFREAHRLRLEMERPEGPEVFTYTVEVARVLGGGAADGTGSVFVIDPKITNQGDGVGGPPPQG